MFYLRFAVIESFGIPIRLIALFSGKAVKMVCTVQFVYPFIEIFDIMGMY